MLQQFAIAVDIWLRIEQVDKQGTARPWLPKDNEFLAMRHDSLCGQILKECSSGNETFFHESRRSMNLTAGICAISRGLNSESNEESGKKSRFQMDTKISDYTFNANKIKMMIRKKKFKRNLKGY
jgi:hypothetical protein